MYGLSMPAQSSLTIWGRSIIKSCPADTGRGASRAASGGEPEPERGSCGERAERTDAGPPGCAVDHGGWRGPGRATEDVGDHIGGVDPAAGLRSERVDGGLVADVERLRAEVEDDDACDQRGERAGTKIKQAPAGEQHHGEDRLRTSRTSRTSHRHVTSSHPHTGARPPSLRF